MDSQYASGAILALAFCVVFVWTLMPTVVSTPRLRQRRPSAIAPFTEPPLESSTMVAPPSCRPRANSSKSLGVSSVTIPIALIQFRQFDWQTIQLNFIGNLRGSKVTTARAEPLRIAINAMQRTRPMSSIPPRIAARCARAEATSEIRAHSLNLVLEVIARLTRNDAANTNTGMTRMLPCLGRLPVWFSRGATADTKRDSCSGPSNEKNSGWNVKPGPILRWPFWFGTAQVGSSRPVAVAHVAD